MKISVIGAGAMGGAMVEGFVKSGAAVPSEIKVSALHESTLERFSRLGVKTTTDNREAVRGSELVILAVKPWLAGEVINEIKPELDYERQAVMSVMAGIDSDGMKEMLLRDDFRLPQIFLAIPNIAIAVSCSMTFIVPVNAADETTRRVKDLFDKAGETLITEERLLAAGTTLASCGIAYAMRYVRASVEGGVELGFKAKDAQRIVAQTVRGAVSLLQAGGGHPEAEIDRVTTPGGLTIRGLNEMEHAGFTSAVIRGLKAGTGR